MLGGTTTGSGQSRRADRRGQRDSAVEGSWDPVGSSRAFRDWATRIGAIWWTRNAGDAAIHAASKARLGALVRFARNYSPLYREAYREIPDHNFDVRKLPVMARHDLMEHFDDWALVEPVDAEYRSVPPGEASATVLVTNLANWVQPIIRYDLGDSVVVNPEACSCGSPLPAIRVEGRRDDVVSLRGHQGQTVRLLPLALTTVAEEALCAHRFQIVQTGVEELTIRLAIGPGSARRAAWSAVAGALRQYLRQQSLANVRLALDTQEPTTDQRSGKSRQVIVVPQRHSPVQDTLH